MQKYAIADCRLYGFIDTAYLAGRKPAELTRQLIAGGVDIIQVRAKKESHSKLTDLAKTVVKSAQDSPVLVIVNDDIKAALESGADGVHLGQEDWEAIPHRDRPRHVADLPILGISTHSRDQAFHAEGDGADYIGVGPIFATGTKPQAQPVSPKLIREVIERVHLPFFVIGGITLDNIYQVLAAGATRVAVVSAILKAPDATAAAKKFKEKLTA